MKTKAIKDLALIVTLNCVRNTVIEDYRAEGKLSDQEMMAFNKEVANKIYTFLDFMFNKPHEDRDAFLDAMRVMYPTEWDEPMLDEDLIKLAAFLKK